MALNTCMITCMATKTISLDLDAYEKLVDARITAKESFSSVIKRGVWSGETKTAQALLTLLEELPKLDVLDDLDVDQKLDKPPRDKWD
jgi:predicted CopG family antitoxin